MSLNDDEASIPFLSEKNEGGEDDGSKSDVSQQTGNSKSSKKSRIKRKFGIKKKGDSGEKDAVAELNKVNDNFWPIGNRSYTLEEKLAIGGGTVAVCLGLGTVFFCATAVSTLGTTAAAAGIMAGGVTAIAMPHAIYNQAALTKLDTFRDVVNAMRGSVNSFANTNKDLHNNVDQLENHIEQLKEIENNLVDLAKTQGMQLEELNELLEENRRINKEMTKVLRSSALQRILALLLECDIDGDFKLSGMELNRFIVGLGAIQELSVDREQLHEGLKEYEDFDINTFLDLIQDIIFPEENADDDSQIEADEWEEAAVVDAVQIVDGRSYLKGLKKAGSKI